MRRLALTLTYSASLASGVWVYTWPYGERNACRCVESSIGSVVQYDSAEDCLKNFAKEDSEYCTYEHEGMSQHKCAAVVSIKQGLFNTDCQTMCTEMLTGFITYEEFIESCRLELTADVGGAVVPAAPDSCFSNRVYGWADFDPHNNIQRPPLAVHPDVDSPSACQQLCQLTEDCVFFSWRATCDPVVAMDGGHQSLRDTCLLYSKEYIDKVLEVDVSNPDSLILSGASEFCDITSLNLNCRLEPLKDSSTFFAFGQHRNCLLCGCIHKCSWYSDAIISGPRFCGDETATACSFPESTVTTTTTAPVCPPENEHPTGIPPTLTTTTPANGGTTTTGIELDSTVISTTTGIQLDDTTVTAGTLTGTTAIAGSTISTQAFNTCAGCLDACSDDDDDCDMCDEYC